jgi:hypothetical protein
MARKAERRCAIRWTRSGGSSIASTILCCAVCSWRRVTAFGCVQA